MIWPECLLDSRVACCGKHLVPQVSSLWNLPLGFKIFILFLGNLLDNLIWHTYSRQGCLVLVWADISYMKHKIYRPSVCFWGSADHPWFWNHLNIYFFERQFVFFFSFLGYFFFGLEWGCLLLFFFSFWLNFIWWR